MRSGHTFERLTVDHSTVATNLHSFFARELRKWWAQYMESTSEMETALQFYEAARDNLSLVRVYCYCGNLEKVSCILTLGKYY